MFKAIKLPEFRKLFWLLCPLILIACGGGSSPIPTQKAIQPEPTEVVLESISINDASSKLKVGETQQLSAIGTYSDQSTQELSGQVSWLSSDTDVFNVSESGLLSAISEGNASISASIENISNQTTAEAISLININLSPSNIKLALASSEQFIATGLYSDNSTEDLSNDVAWSSNTEDLATLTATGKLTTHAAGDASITASINSIQAKMSVTISPATLESISINSPGLLVAGISEQLIATGTFSDGSTQNITTELNWSIENENVGTIELQSGLLNPIQQGVTSINATNDLLSAAQEITISPAIIESIIITPSILTLAQGSQSKVNVTAFFSDHSHQDVTDQVSWASSDNTIAEVSLDDTAIKSHKKGNATITASLSGEYSNLALTVSDAELVSLAILPINTSLPNGLSQLFTANGLFTDGSVQNISSQVTWLSSNESVSTIDNNISSKGVANGLTLGETTITAILGDISRSTQLKVDNAQLNSIEIIPSNTTTAKGLTIQTKAIGRYSDKAQIDISEQVEWSSFDSNIANLSLGKAGQINSFEIGKTLISASLNGITGLGHVTISPATLQSITINGEKSTLPKGTQQTLIATGTYSDNSSHNISTQVTWQSSDNQVLTLDNTNTSSGLVRAIAPGQATVSASLSGIDGEKALSVSNAEIQSLSITVLTSSLNVYAETQASAIATYSDNSTKDVSQEVNWFSSHPEIASVDSDTSNKGLIRGISEGDISLSASFSDISSNFLALHVSQNPNTPSSLNIQLSPNVIINNEIDDTLLTVKLLPTTEDGVIEDGTLVTLTITEGDAIKTETAFTINGIASLTLTSNYNGLILVNASIDSGISSRTSLFSTDSFSNVIAKGAQSQPLYSENNNLLKNSIYAFYLRNLSNRPFDILAVAVTHTENGSEQHFIDSPFTDPELLSSGSLTSGEFTGFGYGLNDDLIDNTSLSIIYLLSDTKTATLFTPGVVFNTGNE